MEIKTYKEFDECRRQLLFGYVIFSHKPVTPIIIRNGQNFSTYTTIGIRDCTNIITLFRILSHGKVQEEHQLNFQRIYDDDIVRIFSDEAEMELALKEDVKCATLAYILDARKTVIEHRREVFECQKELMRRINLAKEYGVDIHINNN